MREFEDGSRTALEIEWNNKDPFYDRDLENFKRLHADGAISIGIIVTRGKSLHENMRDLVRRFLDERQIQNLDDLQQWGYDPTTKQRAAINKRMSRKKVLSHFGRRSQTSSLPISSAKPQLIGGSWKTAFTVVSVIRALWC